MVTAQKAEYIIRKYLDDSPSPNHTIDNGIHAIGGIGLNISKIGRNRADMGLNYPIRIPSTIPMMEPNAKPTRTRLKLQRICPSMVCVPKG